MVLLFEILHGLHFYSFISRVTMHVQSEKQEHIHGKFVFIYKNPHTIFYLLSDFQNLKFYKQPRNRAIKRYNDIDISQYVKSRYQYQKRINDPSYYKGYDTSIHTCRYLENTIPAIHKHAQRYIQKYRHACISKNSYPLEMK